MFDSVQNGTDFEAMMALLARSQMRISRVVEQLTADSDAVTAANILAADGHREWQSIMTQFAMGGVISAQHQGKLPGFAPNEIESPSFQYARELMRRAAASMPAGQ